MKLSELSSGIAAGYAGKLVHTLSAVVLVPFLLDAEVLGVERYGAAFTVLGLISILGILTAGVRFSFDRSIAQAMGDDEPASGGERVGELLGSGTKILFAFALLFSLAAWSLADPLLEWSGIDPSADAVGALVWACVLLSAENGLYLFRTPLLTRGDVAFVNATGAAEVALRTATYFIWFSVQPASISGFFAIQALYTLARQLVLAMRLRRRFPADLDGALSAPLRTGASSLRYSGAVFLTEGATFLVRRAPVIVASQYLGARDAGFVAVVLNTMQGYLLQLLFAVVQPLAVPLASRLDLVRMSDHRRNLVWDVEALYCGFVVLVTSTIALWMPELIELWLGGDFLTIVLPSQLMVAACATEICLSVRRSILIGQGHLPRVVPIFFGSAVLSLAAMLYAAAMLQSWVLVVVGACMHFAVSNVLGANLVFRRVVLRGSDRASSSRFIAILPCFACAIVASQWGGDSSIGAMMLRSTVALAALVSVVSVLIITPGRVRELVTLLVRRRESNLFA